MHFLYFHVFVVVFYQAYQCYSAFTIGTNSLPRRSDALSIGYDNETNTILLFGGVRTENQFIKFKNNQFTDMTATYLTTSTQSTGQHYTQIGHTLWMIDTKGKNLFSIDTQTYVEDSSSVSIPTSTTARGCLASHQHHLFVVAGGDPATNILQIYNISDGEWVINAPNLNHVRRGISCIVSGSSLFAIGGYTGSVVLDSIEVLDLTDVPQIQAKAWQYFGDTLTKTLDSTRSVLYGNDILVIGGYTSPTSPDPCTDVHIILTETEECVLWDTLQTAVSLASSIIIFDTLYVFGGTKQSGAGSNKYQYKVLPQLNPTPMPTAGTTSSINPTMTPTSIPTYNPTIAPTLNPTNVPTLPPSRHPTSIPTTNPTLLSTLSPSDGDTLVPTHHSTSFPTANSASISTVYSTSPLITDTTNAIVVTHTQYNKHVNSQGTSSSSTVMHMDTTHHIATTVYNDNNDILIMVGLGALPLLICCLLYRFCKQGILRRETTVIDNNSPSVKIIQRAMTIESLQLEGKIKTICFEDEYNKNTDNANYIITKQNTVEWLQKAVLVEDWLKQIGLSQYYEVFISNGYDAMPIVKEIVDERALQEIGIVSREHQQWILSHIRELENAHNNNEDEQLENIATIEGEEEDVEDIVVIQYKTCS
eukprot:566503_1